MILFPRRQFINISIISFILRVYVYQPCTMCLDIVILLTYCYNLQSMHQAQQPMFLLLTIKSLTQNRKQKNYLINIQNHNLDNQLTIQNTFAHNYQYVYKLWPCKPATRQLVKIQMLENVDNHQGGTLVKRGEASPLVNYSVQGQKFQFYGAKQEKCVLIFKFRIESVSNIQQQASGNQLERMNNSLLKHLQKNKNQSLSYKKYLHYTDHLIEELKSERPNISNSANPLKQTQQLGYNPKSNRSKRVGEVGSLRYSRRTQMYGQQMRQNNQKDRQKTLSKDKYLNKTIDLNKMDAQMVKLDEKGKEKTKKKEQLDLSSQIKKRRQKYFGQKIQAIIQKPSKSPIFSAIESPLASKFHQNTTLQPYPHPHQSSQPPLATQELVKQDFPINNKQNKRFSIQQQSNKEPTTNKQYINKRQTNQNNEQLIQQKMEQSPKSSSQTQILQKKIKRSNVFPSDQNSYQIPKSFGQIRRKKLPSQNKSIAQSDRNGAVSPDFQPNITHYSISNKTNSQPNPTPFSLNLYNFKAILYTGNKTSAKKLVIIFQDSRYSTDTAPCHSLTTEWRQRFGIRNCRESSHLSFKLLSVSPQRQREEGQTEVSVSDIMSCNKKEYRSYLFVDDLAVGYLQFQFDKKEISMQGWSRESQRNCVSLPQIKKTQIPNGLSNPKNQLMGEPTKQKYQLKHTVSNPSRIQIKKKSSAYSSHPLHSFEPSQTSNRRTPTKMTQQKLLSKIQQKKLKLKAKMR